MLQRVAAIAINTFRESLRDRLFLTLLAVAILVTAGSRIIPPLAVGEGAKIVKDLGLATMTLFCVLISILVGGRLVYREVEKRTILTVLATPLRRWEFIVGKYCGLMLVLSVSVAVLTVWFLAFVLVCRVEVEPRLLVAPAMLLLELGVITAVAVLFSTFVTPISGAVFTAAIYVAGNTSKDLLGLADMHKSGAVKALAKAFYYLLPNLRNLDVRATVVHGQPLDPSGLCLSAAYAVIYSTAVLLLAVHLFRRKSF